MPGFPSALNPVYPPKGPKHSETTTAQVTRRGVLVHERSELRKESDRIRRQLGTLFRSNERSILGSGVRLGRFGLLTPRVGIPRFQLPTPILLQVLALDQSGFGFQSRSVYDYSRLLMGV